MKEVHIDEPASLNMQSRLVLRNKGPPKTTKDRENNVILQANPNPWMTLPKQRFRAAIDAFGDGLGRRR